MRMLFNAIPLLGLFLALTAFPGQDAKKYHILYSGQSEAAYGPCG